MLLPEDSVLKVRRSVLVKATRSQVREAFDSIERMRLWWGLTSGEPEAGTPKGQWLDKYEPRVGGRIEMAVMWDGARARYGGVIQVLDENGLTFENDWIPNRGWAMPTYMSVRLTSGPDGTLVELFHYGFERTGADAASEHEGYETGWGMLQLTALRRLVDGA